MADKPRILQNNRDIALSLIPLVVVCLIVAGLAGQCSFSPGGPTAGEVPHYEAAAVLKKDARMYAMPIRLPETPAGWQTNSGGTDPIDGDDGGTAIRVGYITDGGDYLEFVQSNAQATALARFMAHEARPAAGSERVDGVEWTVYSRDGAEPVWVADRGSVRWGLTGSADGAAFRTLASAIAGADPLPGDY